jgi:hypothetical protein
MWAGRRRGIGRAGERILNIYTSLLGMRAKANIAFIFNVTKGNVKLTNKYSKFGRFENIWNFPFDAIVCCNQKVKGEISAIYTN